MFAQQQAEWELAHKPKYQLLLNALEGIASCATNCGCCRMHKEIAEEAIARFTKETP